MIKAILFDNGNVLIEDAWLEFIDDVSKRNNINTDSVLKLIKPVEDKTVVGDINYAACLEQLAEVTGQPESVSVLKRKYPINPEMIKILESLKSHYVLGLLSNDRGDFEDKNPVWQMEKYFKNRIFLSSDLGCAKPGEQIFEIALKKLGLSGNEVLFIDDKQRNIETARSLGMLGIQFISPGQLRVELEKALGKDYV